MNLALLNKNIEERSLWKKGNSFCLIRILGIGHLISWVGGISKELCLRKLEKYLFH